MDFPADPRLDNYCVVGNPVAHSKSPRIHRAFANQLGMEIAYQAITVPITEFAQALLCLRRGGFKGMNITVPFKQEACSLSEVLTDRARRAGSVNTITFSTDKRIHGDTTDGAGLINYLRNHDIDLKGKRVLLLGAGGAVRGVLFDLNRQAPARLCITNRTAARAEEIRFKFSEDMQMEVLSLKYLAGQTFDVIINGTSASLKGEMLSLPEGILAPGSCCYDMVYGDEDTIFMRWARVQGARYILDGLGMLVEQAAESFRIWTGLSPQTQPVMQMLRLNPKA
jgi:shikimate dehydrogenase